MTDAFGLPNDAADGKRPAVPGQSIAMREAATNLLHKAVRALEAAQPENALAHVRRAERLPHDDNGAASPLSVAAHMYALESVLDVLESGDGVWIDAAEILRDRTKKWAALAVADFRHVLTVVRDDSGTSPADDRKLTALIAGQRVATIREMQELAGEELCTVVMDLLDIVLEYGQAAEAIVAGRWPDDH